MDNKMTQARRKWIADWEATLGFDFLWDRKKSRTGSTPVPRSKRAIGGQEKI